MPKRSYSRSRSRSPIKENDSNFNSLTNEEVKLIMLEEINKEKVKEPKYEKRNDYSGERKNSKICRDYIKGNCFYGSDCRFSHDIKLNKDKDVVEHKSSREIEWGKKEEKKEGVVVEKPNFGTSGLLAADAKTGLVYKGFILKFCEPPEARNPKVRYRLYVFKPNIDEPIEILHIHRQSAYLIGKQQEICDLYLEHGSISKQHAVIQYRLIANEERHEVVPYIMDLGSSNGTFLNGERIEPQRYYELMIQDLLKFGASSREYILLKDETVQ